MAVAHFIPHGFRGKRPILIGHVGDTVSLFHVVIILRNRTWWISDIPGNPFPDLRHSPEVIAGQLPDNIGIRSDKLTDVKNLITEPFFYRVTIAAI